jgi:hypothetical protein
MLTGGAEYLNLHYTLTDKRFETTAFIKVDAEIAATVSF